MHSSSRWTVQLCRRKILQANLLRHSSSSAVTAAQVSWKAFPTISSSDELLVPAVPMVAPEFNANVNTPPLLTPTTTSLSESVTSVARLDPKRPKIVAKKAKTTEPTKKRRTKAQMKLAAEQAAVEAGKTVVPTTDTIIAPMYQEFPLLENNDMYASLEPAPFPESMPSMAPTSHSYSAGNAEVEEQADLGIKRNQIEHVDLQSFEGIDHNTTSTIYRGTLFEYQTQEILRKQLGIYTQRSAGRGDLGVDLRGTWYLPTSANPQPESLVRHLKVIVQCKQIKHRVGPKYVRELQGSLSYESQPTMAFLAISSGFTPLSLLPYTKSVWPMALVVIDTEQQDIKQLMWNQAAEKVMFGLQIGTRWKKNREGKLAERPVLCFKGEVLKNLPGRQRLSSELGAAIDSTNLSQSSASIQEHGSNTSFSTVTF